jgi:hypothetical protein
MTRIALPFSAPDLSALARSLERSLAQHQTTHGRLPGHVEMMNLLARSVGNRNLQAFQAATTRSSPVATSAEPGSSSESALPAADVVHDAWFDTSRADPPVPSLAEELDLTTHARKALQHFDGAGRLQRWPQKLSVQRLAMWVLWTRFDGRRVYSEPEINRVLKAWHLFGDHATLRRELVNHKLLTRKSDCSEYRKIALRPDAEVRSLLQALRRRRATSPRRLHVAD